MLNKKGRKIKYGMLKKSHGTVDQPFRNAFNLAQAGVSDILKAVKAFRIVFGILAIIPLALLADKIFFRPTDYDEDSLRTLAYLVFGVPILILNFWAWGASKTIEFYFFGKNYEES